MKHLVGFFAGVAVGGYLASNMTAQQRSKVGGAAARVADGVRSSTVVSSVTGNVAKVGGEMSERVANVVDSAGDKIADTVSAS